MGVIGQELWQGNTLVTSSRPNWPGVQVYIAGGSGISGSVPVQLTGVMTTSFDQPHGPGATGLVVRPIWDTYSMTAFDELRVSHPYVLEDLISRYGRSTTLTEATSSNSASVTDVTDQSAFRLSVSGSASDYAAVRTNQWYRYQTGRGQRITLTAYTSDTGSDGRHMKWGYFDSYDGLGWYLSGTTFGSFKRTSTAGTGSVAESFTSSSAWSVDPMDGTGPSGITLDTSKGNIYEIQFQWLGVGVVNYFVNGYLVHRLMHPNTLPYPYMKSADLPMSWEVSCSAPTTSGSLTVICGNVTSESGEEPPLYGGSAVSDTVTTTDATETPIMAIRLKSLLNGVDNRAVVFPVAAALDNQSTVAGASAVCYIRLNPTLTGATWGSGSTTSAVEYDLGATAVSGGTVVERFVVPATEGEHVDLSKFFKKNARKLVRSAFGGVSDTLVLSVQRQGANNVTAVGSVFWNEVL